MESKQLEITRIPLRFTSDARRVITRLFLPGEPPRLRKIIDLAMQLDEPEVKRLLGEVNEFFAGRHHDLASTFRSHYQRVAEHLPEGANLSDDRQLLMGAYFTSEYSFESAALFNPSIVPHPYQDGVPPGSIRFLMSLRATGEGHVSSIVFRCGLIDSAGHITVAPVSPYARSLKPAEDQVNEKQSFFEKLIEMGAYNDTVGDILDMLPDRFTDDAVDRVLDELTQRDPQPPLLDESAESLRWLARSDYLLRLPENTCPSEIVIFPATENESRGMEDMRLVRFVDDDGTATYHGVYTAFNGFRVLPMLMTTTNFRPVEVTPLHGRYVQNKGLALFPRRLNGWYAMISRFDGRNLFLMRSKNIRFWNEADRICGPAFPWQYVQIGNCGSPIETPKGWLLVTHGVGPMRKYCIGVALLDLNDPARVIGQLREPLITPAPAERDGYVPNVVYSCGSMIHRDQLIIPYAMSDSATTFATVRVAELLDHLANQAPS